MVLTFWNLVGTLENFDKTLAFRFNAAWVPANVGQTTNPTFGNATDKGGDYSWPRNLGNYEIHFNQDDNDFPLNDEQFNGNNYQALKTTVYVDIFTRNLNTMKLYINEFNRIVWDVLRPDSNRRILKSDGSNSHIARFESYNINFRKERTLQPEQIEKQSHSSGEIGVIWYKSRS